MPQLVGAATARVSWDKLVTAYALGSRPLTKLHVQKAKGIADKLAALQYPIPNDDLVEFVLTRLGPAYHPFTRSLAHVKRILVLMHCMKPILSLHLQHSLLRVPFLPLVDVVEVKGVEVVDAPTIRVHPIINTTPSQASTISGIICHNCEGKGHRARVCPFPRINNNNKAYGPAVSNLARTSCAQDWLMDSGTTHHFTADLNNLGIHSDIKALKKLR
ncbi:hypothetical protein A4A49_53117 [Nicotiana attenuata]|uniref:CCHC-type domain-containing protein n=1 Tax=Nicotiana attenuata TaxID=49451 RepID=A0A314KP94_NICAT|nr:hypothetical protein A4A49_53117 [Nicotiana attenuata]